MKGNTARRSNNVLGRLFPFRQEVSNHSLAVMLKKNVFGEGTNAYLQSGHVFEPSNIVALVIGQDKEDVGPLSQS